MTPRGDVHTDDSPRAAFVPFSDPRTVQQWAAVYRRGRKSMGVVLRDLEHQGDAKRFGGEWQIRLDRLPPWHLLAMGVLVPASVDESMWDILGETDEPWDADEYAPPARDSKPTE